MIETALEQILARYQSSFIEKIYAEENEEHDVGVYFPKMKNVEPNRHTMSSSLKEIVETGCQSYD